MDQGLDIIYCCDLICQKPNKIMKNLDEYLESEHNGHKIRKISLLQKEMQQISTEENIRDDMMKYIDQEIESISKFLLSGLSTKLRSLVVFPENISKKQKKKNNKNFRQLSHALVSNNQNEIFMFQEQLDLLIESNQNLSEILNSTTRNIKSQLENVLKLVKHHISEIDKINFNQKEDNKQKFREENNIILGNQVQQNPIHDNDATSQLMSINKELETIKNSQSVDLKQMQIALSEKQQQLSDYQNQLKQSHEQNNILKEKYRNHDFQFKAQNKKVEVEKISTQSQYSSNLEESQLALTNEQQRSMTLEDELEKTLIFVDRMKIQLVQKTNQFDQLQGSFKNEQMKLIQSQNQLKQSQSQFFQSQEMQESLDLQLRTQNQKIEIEKIEKKKSQIQYSTDIKQLQSALVNEQQKLVQIEAELKQTVNFVNQLKNQINQKTLQYDQNIKNIESEKERINTNYQQLLLKQQTANEYPQPYTQQRFQKPQSLHEESFEWDNINKHSAFVIQGKIARLIGNHNIYKTILFKQQLFYVGKTKTVQLKIHGGTVESTYFMIHICDLRALKINCPDFEASYNCKTFSLKSNGTSYNTDGTKQQSGLILDLEDIIDLQWDGPLKQFTITNTTTQQKIQLTVQFPEAAEIHFGVSLNNGSSAQIL